MEERKKGRKTVDVVIPVYKAGDEFVKLLHGLAKQSYPIEKIVIMNTGKEYWKESWEREVPNMEVHHIEKSEFDHGGTRDEAVGVLLPGRHRPFYDPGCDTRRYTFGREPDRSL